MKVISKLVLFNSSLIQVKGLTMYLLEIWIYKYKFKLKLF